MNRHFAKRGVLLLGVMIMSACAPADSTTLTPTEPSVRVNSTVTVAPKISETPSTIIPTADLTMEIGSTVPYADGGILVPVPAGEFLMGGHNAENPEHLVFLNDFWIYSTEVTNQQYSLCESLGECTSPDLGDNPSYTNRQNANDPVVGVTYDQAAAYCRFVNGRLPAEAEWEKSARNSESDIYPWGSAEPICDLLNFNDCVGNTSNVINYQDGASVYGALDMAGNTFEWVADWFDPDYYNVSPEDNPHGPASGTIRSVRSSSFASDADQVKVINRNFEDPQNHRPDLGFRCVIDEPTYFAPFCESPLIYDSSTQSSNSSESCPTLDIKEAQFCIGKLPATNVKFEGPSDSVIDSSTCVPSDDPNLFTCQTPGTIVSITANCQLNESRNPTCLPGFSQKDNGCIADGGTGQCLIGDYDSSQQCCVTPADQAEKSSLTSICPVGTFYVASKKACLPYPVQEIVSFSLDVGFTSCTTVDGGGGGGGSGGDSCQPPAAGCPYESDWTPYRCCCVYFDTGVCADP